jgi:predicted acyltransferase
MADTSLTPAPANRLASLDAYRGFVMFLMAAELLEVPQVAASFPDSGFWQFLKHHTTHVTWTGCSLHDLIQPSFSFMVGAALPFSMASRLAKGQSKPQLFLHALWRSLVLILLGVFLRSIDDPITNWTFEDTLSQIGLGYPFLFLLGFASTRLRWVSLAVILAGYWLAFACFRLPPADFNDSLANIPKNWSHHFEGFAAHWNINRNAAWAFDTWFMNLFPRQKPFLGNSGGYSTLSFIPTLGTMLLGLIAGAWLKEAASSQSGDANTDSKAKESVTTKLIITGLACLALGWLLHFTGVCPIVKKIWTPAWTLLSGGWCCFLMVGFFYVMDVIGWKRWAFPLTVIGMNSIAMYVMVHTIAEFIGVALRTHLGDGLFLVLGKTYAPMLHGAAALLILWLILLWMHRRKLYLRI